MKEESLKVCTCAEPYTDSSSVSERTVRMHQGKGVCEGCMELMRVNGGIRSKRLLFKYMAEVTELRKRLSLLKGAVPALPPRPPEGGGLPRYGVRWTGDNQPITVPMDDGYWTPYHLAEKMAQSLVEDGVGVSQIKNPCPICEKEERIEGEGWCVICMDEFFLSEDSKE